MATSVNDPRVLAAISKAQSWARSQVGRATARSVWSYVYPQWANTGYAWCGGFQAAAYKQAGVDLMKCAWWFYTPYIKNFAISIGAWRTSPGSQKDGDQSLFDWGPDGVIDHVGMAWRDPSSSLFRNIEGNTSASSGGSQDNGGQCAIKYRAFPPLRGWVDMRKVLAWMIDTGRWDGKISDGSTSSTVAPVVQKKNSTDGNYLLAEDGVRGATTNARWQQVMGTAIDGRIDRPSPAVKKFQTFLNSAVAEDRMKQLTGATKIAADGLLGAKTWKAFQYWFGATYPDAMKSICGFTRSSNNNRFWAEWCDGVEGAWTSKALQWILNRSWSNTGALGTSKKLGTTSTPAAPAKPATPSTPAASASTTKKAPDGKALITVDGIRGTATNKRWQEVMGTPADGKIDRPSPAVKKFQKFLNSAVVSGHIVNLTGSARLAEDGYLGTNTWKVFQFWFANKYPDDMKAICGFTIVSNINRFWSEWANGVEGVWTKKALQTVLNKSWAGSGKLDSK